MKTEPSWIISIIAALAIVLAIGMFTLGGAVVLTHATFEHCQ